MKIDVEINAVDLQRLVYAELESIIGDKDFERSKVTIEMRATDAVGITTGWVRCEFRATYKGEK